MGRQASQHNQPQNNIGSFMPHHTDRLIHATGSFMPHHTDRLVHASDVPSAHSCLRRIGTRITGSFVPHRYYRHTNHWLIPPHRYTRIRESLARSRLIATHGYNESLAHSASSLHTDTRIIGSFPPHRYTLIQRIIGSFPPHRYTRIQRTIGSVRRIATHKYTNHWLLHATSTTDGYTNHRLIHSSR